MSSCKKLVLGQKSIFLSVERCSISFVHSSDKFAGFSDSQNRELKVDQRLRPFGKQDLKSEDRKKGPSRQANEGAEKSFSPGQTIEQSWIPHPALLDVNVEIVAKPYPTLLDETNSVPGAI